MLSHVTRLALLVASLLITTTACSGEPEIPDQPPTSKTYQYRSTESGGDTTAGATKTATTGGAATTPGDKPTSAPKATGPVALVNGEPISADEFNAEIAKIAGSGRVPPQFLHQAKGKIVQSLVQRKLVKLAITQNQIKVTPPELDAKLAEVKGELEKSGQGVKFEDMLKRMNITEAEFKEKLEEVVAIEKLLKKRGMAKPSDTEVRAYYDANPDTFTTPEQVRARHILVRVPGDADAKTWEAAHAKAKELYAKASAADADFAALAKAHSDGPSSVRGGDLGFFDKAQMVKPFAEAAFTLKDGGVSEPVKTRFGWHVIKREAHRPAGKLPFEDVKDDLARKLEGERQQGALVKLLKELEESAKVELKLENIS